tara:strand:+ start:42 stop:503 length:462 start_codon:yes stop_codon:yes gene_type:complete
MNKIFNNAEEPVIYIRYMNGVVMYIGETKNWKRGRPFRDGASFDEKENAGEYDKVRLLKANFNPERRRYWEAVLVTKYKPHNQQKVLKKYYKLTNKKIIKDSEILEHVKNSVKIMRNKTNDKLKIAAKVYLIKHYEIMIHLKKMEKKNERHVV